MIHLMAIDVQYKFQSTYLYKVRQSGIFKYVYPFLFQSTYLYKVRHITLSTSLLFPCFNPRTYIRYDKRPWALIVFIFVFQSTYLYKVRHELGIRSKRQTGFNPRTYIRYDAGPIMATPTAMVSIHVPI